MVFFGTRRFREDDASALGAKGEGVGMEIEAHDESMEVSGVLAIKEFSLGDGVAEMRRMVGI